MCTKQTRRGSQLHIFYFVVLVSSYCKKQQIYHYLKMFKYNYRLFLSWYVLPNSKPGRVYHEFYNTAQCVGKIGTLLTTLFLR